VQVKIVISSAHGLKVRGAAGYLDEVDESRRVVEEVADELRRLDVDVVVFHDDTSTTQDENLKTIVDVHNGHERDLDVSIHFNSFGDPGEVTTEPMGVEVFYVSQPELADDVSAAIAEVSDLKNRGPKYTDNFYFLNQTEKPAILCEICFVNSAADTELYLDSFEEICAAIAATVVGDEIDQPKPQPQVLARFSGPCSWFGGPEDEGVAPDEGLAFIYEVSDAPWLFLEDQPEDTTGLARRLDPDIYYIACRWDYSVTSKSMLLDSGQRALVKAKKTGKQFRAWPADWGPHEDTGRAADISPGLMDALGIDTDDEVEVIYPAPRKN
jgi:N-acetylmuramoyl-L-alanine amidase